MGMSPPSDSNLGQLRIGARGEKLDVSERCLVQAPAALSSCRWYRAPPKRVRSIHLSLQHHPLCHFRIQIADLESFLCRPRSMNSAMGSKSLTSVRLRPPPLNNRHSISKLTHPNLHLSSCHLSDNAHAWLEAFRWPVQVVIKPGIGSINIQFQLFRRTSIGASECSGQYSHSTKGFL